MAVRRHAYQGRGWLYWEAVGTGSPQERAPEGIAAEKEAAVAAMAVEEEEAGLGVLEVAEASGGEEVAAAAPGVEEEVGWDHLGRSGQP